MIKSIKDNVQPFRWFDFFINDRALPSQSRSTHHGTTNHYIPRSTPKNHKRKDSSLSELDQPVCPLSQKEDEVAVIMQTAPVPSCVPQSQDGLSSPAVVRRQWSCSSCRNTSCPKTSHFEPCNSPRSPSQHKLQPELDSFTNAIHYPYFNSQSHLSWGEDHSTSFDPTSRGIVFSIFLTILSFFTTCRKVIATTINTTCIFLSKEKFRCIHFRRKLEKDSACSQLAQPPQQISKVSKTALIVLVVIAALLSIQLLLYMALNGSCEGHTEADAIHPDSVLRPPVVEYYIHGHGRGHASRGKTVIQALEQAGYKVCVFVDNHVADLVEGVGTETVRVASLPIADSAKTVWDTIRIIVSRFVTDSDCSVCNRAQRQPDLVLSDGDFPGMWRASRANIPAVALGHGYLFSTTEKPSHVSEFAWGHQQVLNGRTTRLADCTVDVSFVPLQPLNENTTIVAKPRLREAVLRTRRNISPNQIIVVYFRDAGSGADVLEELAKTNYEIRAFGPVTSQIGNIHVQPFDEKLFITSISEASAVIGTSGDNLIAECMWLGIPMLAMYDAVDSEQLLNAEMFEYTGLGMASSFQTFSSDQLTMFLNRLPEFEARAKERTLTQWNAPDTINAAFECIRRVSPLASRWNEHTHRFDDDNSRHRRLLVQLARTI